MVGPCPGARRDEREGLTPLGQVLAYRLVLTSDESSRLNLTPQRPPVPHLLSVQLRRLAVPVSTWQGGRIASA